MATTPGQRFVRRHDAARTTTSNTTAADVTYDTAVLSEGGYSWASPEVTVDEAGLYLAVFDIGQVDVASTRACGTLVPSINSTDQTRFRATHRYLRNSGGTEGASIGMAILDLAASDQIKVRNPGVLTPTDAVGNYATRSSFGGGIQLIRLPATNFTHVERTVDAAECGVSNINATRPWIDSSGTWTTITYNSEVNDDGALYSGSGGNITLPANTKCMIVWGMTPYSTDASRHAYVGRLRINGVNVQTASSYQRNTGSQGPPLCGMYLHETGGSAETAILQATQESEGGDAGTPQIADAYFQVIELPASAEWIHADNSTTDSLTTALAGTGTWYDTPLSSVFRADGGSNLSLDSANDAIQNDSGGSLSVLAIGWQRWDRNSGASGVRKMPWSAWENGGTRLGYGVAGAFSRGQQSGDDTWQAHFCSVAAMDMAASADLSFQVNEPASSSNSDMGIFASTNRHFLGVQVLNLASLDAVSSDVNVNAATDALALTEQSAEISLDVGVSASTDVLSLTEYAATVSSDTSIAAGVDPLSLTEYQAAIGIDRNITASFDSLSITEYAATIQSNVAISAGFDALSLTEYAADVSLGINISAAVDALSITEQSATITLDAEIAASFDALTLTSYQASITADNAIQASFDNLTLTEYPATLTIDTEVSASVSALSVTTYPVSLSEDNNIAASFDALALTEYQSQVTLDTVVSVGVDPLSLTERQASISSDVGISASVDPLSLTEFGASISLNVNIDAGYDQLTLTESAALVASGGGISVATANLTLTEYPAVVEFKRFRKAGAYWSLTWS